ncbi:MAG: hypothetical protein US60_C0003G0035 [Microgenomates group bacterium GW2011_GWC1_37_8]|uniref:Uncharacterized protein n=1 Tax=Candidatus Woesebacteria bacterium GW2011_GWB1_38_8 TaxID=1618570 RepID=A0A0G0NIP6_9BACT|nr:MAG: hypothetical protein US60_C0003G0035 [Microgenomates group bacterium GW2011_GWC1_37_8]KKQ85764.1 MAG: hypothetical protein UT08_C0004G0076 [Candidatus Woesebacteria bacterium GW2011_GWB1_38_8]
MDIKNTIDGVINQEVDPNRLANLFKQKATIVSKAVSLKILIIFPVVIIILIMLTYKGLPLYIGGGFILFILVLAALQFISYKKIRAVNLDEKVSSRNTISIGVDEKVIDYIVGIMRTGLELREAAYLGTGKIRHPENALLVTDHQIIFIVVPVKGADKLIAETDIAMWQWLLSKKILRRN